MLQFSLQTIILMVVVTQRQAHLCTPEDPSSHVCAGLPYDDKRYLCCDGVMHKNLTHLTCCGNATYNVHESSCCNGVIKYGLSGIVSDCCGAEAYNPINQLCCENHVIIKTTAHSACCGTGLYDEKTQNCCKSIILNKTKDSEVCCFDKLYDIETQCCCFPDVKNINDPCCRSDNVNTSTSSGSKPQTTPSTKENPTPADMKQAASPSDETKAPSCQSWSENANKICCLGKIFPKNSNLTECCGDGQYSPLDEGLLCCDGKLYHDQPPDSLCYQKVAYSPSKTTICQGKGHPQKGQHCCGNDIYNPNKEICCGGHRHLRCERNMTCCGTEAYDISDDRRKCCSGHIHQLPAGMKRKDAECCGTVLLKKDQQCCHSDKKAVRYDKENNHTCCGHLYYNKSLWHCCAGRLFGGGSASSTKQLPDLMDFNFSTKCSAELRIGTVLSVVYNETHFTVTVTHVVHLTATLIFSGGHKTFEPLDRCSFPPLDDGKTYLWKAEGDTFEPISRITHLHTAIHAYQKGCHCNHGGGHC